MSGGARCHAYCFGWAGKVTQDCLAPGKAPDVRAIVAAYPTTDATPGANG
jgi:hypothetical protein